MKTLDFVNSLSAGLIAAGRYRRLESYYSVLRSVARFRGSTILTLKLVFTRNFLCAYRDYLLQQGCKQSTITSYVSSLHSIYSRAVEVELLPYTAGLFDGLSARVAPSVKRALPAELLARILAADLSLLPHLEVCRDYFMLSLLLQGIPFVDLAHLRKNNISGNTVHYYRKKTGGEVRVALLPEAKAIFAKYADQVKDSPYLLPLITHSGEEARRQYKAAIHRQNLHLKKLAAYLDIEDNLTTYVARHSWATTAYHNGVGVGVVSQALGHQAEGVTRVYLANFRNDRLIEANQTVLNAILKPIIEGRITDVRPEIKEQVKQQEQIKNNLSEVQKYNDMQRRELEITEDKKDIQWRNVTTKKRRQNQCEKRFR